MLGISVILLLATIISLITSFYYKKRNVQKGKVNPAKTAIFATVAFGIATVIAVLSTMVYTQDPGQASVLVSLTMRPAYNSRLLGLTA